ncbi:MAG: methyltransferase domain-containing protein [Patescibacteria group bacterium]|nr:class I SAM-dependent methyltransferase [Patescibacteria group bacterium]
MELETKIKTKNSTSSNLDPQAILDKLELKSGDIIADLGCGSGHFVIPAAKITGDKGLVFAIDVLEKRLGAVQSQANLNYLNNIVTGLANLETAGSVAKILKNKKADLIILSDVLFANDDKNAIIQQVLDNLAPRGRLIIIDWENNRHPAAPSKDMLVSSREIIELCRKNKLKPLESLPAGQYHWARLFIRA